MLLSGAEQEHEINYASPLLSIGVDMFFPPMLSTIYFRWFIQILINVLCKFSIAYGKIRKALDKP
jgi:hypothetical protein